MYDIHRRLIGKRAVNFMLVLMELFCYRYVLRLRRYEGISIKNLFFASKGSVLPTV